MGNGAGFFGFAARCQISSTASSRGSHFLRWSDGFASTVASEGSLLCILHRPFKIHQRSAGEVRHQGLPYPCFTDAQRGQSIWDHASVTPLAGVPLFSGVDNGDSSALVHVPSDYGPRVTRGGVRVRCPTGVLMWSNFGPSLEGCFVIWLFF